MFKPTTKTARTIAPLALALALALLAAPHPAHAQNTDGKNYIRLGFGLSYSEGADFTGDSNDRGSLCDEYINPAYEKIPRCTAETAQDSDGWYDSFSSASGSFGSLAFGRQLRNNLRIEAEYFVANINFGQTFELTAATSSTDLTADKTRNELARVAERLGTARSNNFFANIYMGFETKNRFTPHLGFGLGYSEIKADWASQWTRSDSPDDIATGDTELDDGLITQAELDTIKTNLAGTSSIANTTLKSDSFAYQFLAGFDYALSERSAIGLQMRYVIFEDEFSDRLVWDPLRGHPPYNRRDGTMPVTGSMVSDDMDFYALAITLTQKF